MRPHTASHTQTVDKRPPERLAITVYKAVCQHNVRFAVGLCPFRNIIKLQQILIRLLTFYDNIFRIDRTAVYFVSYSAAGCPCHSTAMSRLIPGRHFQKRIFISQCLIDLLLRINRPERNIQSPPLFYTVIIPTPHTASVIFVSTFPGNTGCRPVRNRLVPDRQYPAAAILPAERRHGIINTGIRNTNNNILPRQPKRRLLYLQNTGF